MDSTCPHPVIILIDETALYFAITGLRADGPDEAAAWLLAEYDDTGNPFQASDVSEAHHSTLWRGVYVQPIFTLKSTMAAGKQMRICARDYADPDGLFL
jgi:hypothetical protein